jgi:carbon monoxide dehydrogenase subunit G
MQIESSFEVPASPAAAWELLMDVPRVVPCMPGAELTEVVDDSNWKAKMSVKLGPIALNFVTDIRREQVDDAAHHVVLAARGRELRGRGGATAKIDGSLTEIDGGTRVALVTDLSLSGPMAQYGRGVVQDVSEQLVGQFADCLRGQLDGGTGDTAAAPAAAPSRPATPIAGGSLAWTAFKRAVARLFRRLTGSG